MVCTYTQSNDGFVKQNFGADDVWVFKIDAQGDTVWTSVLGGTASDRAYRIVFDADGGLLIAGKTLSNDLIFSTNRGAFDGFSAKLNAQSGATIWLRTYGGSQDDGFYGIIPTADGGYLLYGETGSVDGDIAQTSHAGSMEAWVVKTNAAGQILWQHLTSGIVNNSDWIETFFSAVEMPNNQGFWLSGITGNFMDFNTDDILLCKYNAQGTQVIKKVTGSPSQDAPGGLTLTGSAIYVSARVGSLGLDVSAYNGGMADCWAASFDFEGNLLWDKSYGGSEVEYPYDITVDPLGNLWMSAVTMSNNGFSVWPGFGGFDAWYLKLNASNGDTLKTIRKGGSGADFGHALAFTPNNAFAYTVGRTRSDNGYAHANNGASGTVDVFVTKWVYEDITNVAFIPKNKSLIYPNPTADLINIQNSSATINQISVFDISGKEVLKTSGFYKSEGTLDLSFLNAGVYFIQIQTNEGVETQQLIKQ